MTRRTSLAIVWAAAAAFTFGIDPAPGVVLDDRAPAKVWIDTDAGCGEGARRDVDDCWALIQAFRSGEVYVRGVSSVFGNVDEETAFRVAGRMVRRFGRREDGSLPIVRRGARASLDAGAGLPPAVTELADVLRNERLTVIALGPATNIAALLNRFPDRAASIDRIVMVAGTRKNDPWLTTDGHPFVHFHDQNLQMDPRAMERVLHSGVPVVLAPFEAARQVTITAADLDRLVRAGESGRFLASVSRSWADTWQRWIGKDGFHPFDTIAIGLVAWPWLFDCAPVAADVVHFAEAYIPRYRDRLSVTPTKDSQPAVRYCAKVDNRFKDQLLSRVGGY